MFFEIKTEAGRFLHHHMVFMTVAAFAMRAARLLCLALPAGLCLFLSEPLGTVGAMAYAGASVPPMIFICAMMNVVYTASVNKRYGSALAGRHSGFLRKTVNTAFAAVLIAFKKAGWFLLFCLPALIPAAAMSALSADGRLYRGGSKLFLAASGLLLIIGIIFYSANTRIYDMEKYLYAGGLSGSELRLRMEWAGRKQYAAFLFSCLAWRILSVVPLIGIYALPFCEAGKIVYFNRSAAVPEDVRIYRSDDHGFVDVKDHEAGF